MKRDQTTNIQFMKRFEVKTTENQRIQEVIQDGYPSRIAGAAVNTVTEHIRYVYCSTVAVKTLSAGSKGS